MRVAIVDDQSYWRQRICDCARACFGEVFAEIMLFASGEELLEQKAPFDILFLDVEMEGIDGFETAVAYQHRYPDSYIVILTMHGELSSRGYEVNAFRYIDKSEMEAGVTEAWQSLQLRVQSGKSIRFKVFNEGDIEISENDILAIETIRHGVLVHTLAKDFRVAESIGKLAKKLDRECFFRTHHSWIVHWKYVDRIEGSDIIISGGTDPIRAMLSQSQAPAAKKSFYKFCFERARG